MITVYKLVKVEASFGEFQPELERFLLNEVRKYLLYFFKSVSFSSQFLSHLFNLFRCS